jgi:hypothetical protein
LPEPDGPDTTSQPPRPTRPDTPSITGCPLSSQRAASPSNSIVSIDVAGNGAVVSIYFVWAATDAPERASTSRRAGISCTAAT